MQEPDKSIYRYEINAYFSTCAAQKKRFIDLEYFVNTLLTLAWLKTLTAFFLKQYKWNLSGSCMEPFNCLCTSTFIFIQIPY